MAIQSYSWFRTNSQSTYAQMETYRAKLHAFNQAFLDDSATLNDSLLSANVTQSSGLAALILQMANKRISDAINAKVSQATALASSVDVKV